MRLLAARRLRPAVPFSLVALVALTACDPGAKARATAAADSLAVLSTRLADAEQGVQQRDALMSELAQTATLVNAIDSSLASVKGLKPAAVRRRDGGADDPWSARHDSLLAKVDGVTQLLAQTRSRVATLDRSNGALQGRLKDYQSTIAALEGTVERQKVEIAAYAAAVDSLRQVGTVLAQERDAVRDTLRGERDVASTVYYVVGSKKELLQRDVVDEEGNKRFMVLGSRTLVPSRTLDHSAFVAADQRQELVIALPDPGKEYKVVSRHDPSLLVSGRGADGAPDGTLRITDPSRFWSASRYLIVVQN